MVEDIQTLVESNPDISSSAYFYLINRLTELEDIETCTELIKKIEGDFVQDLFVKSINEFCQRIDDGDIGREKIQDFQEVIKILQNQLKETASEFLLKNIQKKVDNLKKLIILREKFGFTVCMKNLNKPAKQKEMFQDGVLSIIEKLDKKRGNLLRTVECDVNILCHCFNLAPIQGLYEICTKLGNLYFTCGVVDSIVCSAPNTEKELNFAVDFAVLLIAQSIEYFEENCEFLFKFSFYFLNQPKYIKEKIVRENLRH
jgi:hypothetical protein